MANGDVPVLKNSWRHMPYWARAIYVAFCSTVFSVAISFVGVYLYCISQDPYLTPRFRFHSELFFGVGFPLHFVLLVLVPVGLLLVFLLPGARRCRLMWWAIGAAAALVVFPLL